MSITRQIPLSEIRSKSIRLMICLSGKLTNQSDPFLTNLCLQVLHLLHGFRLEVKPFFFIFVPKQRGQRSVFLHI